MPCQIAGLSPLKDIRSYPTQEGVYRTSFSCFLAVSQSPVYLVGAVVSREFLCGALAAWDWAIPETTGPGQALPQRAEAPSFRCLKRVPVKRCHRAQS